MMAGFAQFLVASQTVLDGGVLQQEKKKKKKKMKIPAIFCAIFNNFFPDLKVFKNLIFVHFL